VLRLGAVFRHGLSSRDRFGRLPIAGQTPKQEVSMGSLVKKRRKKMSKHKYRKRIKANRHKRKK